MIKIALDQSIGVKNIKKLEQYGYTIVCMAKQAEADASWMSRAFNSGAQFIVSSDLDIPSIIEKERYPMVWIDYPHHNKVLRETLAPYVHSKINFKLKLFRKLSKVSV